MDGVDKEGQKVDAELECKMYKETLFTFLKNLDKEDPKKKELLNLLAEKFELKPVTVTAFKIDNPPINITKTVYIEYGESGSKEGGVNEDGHRIKPTVMKQGSVQFEDESQTPL